jgi:hypothetical protein
MIDPFRGHFLSSEPFMNQQFSFFEIFAPTLSYALSTFVDKSNQGKELDVIPLTWFLANIALRELKLCKEVRNYVNTVQNLGSMAQKAINQAITKTHTTKN